MPSGLGETFMLMARSGPAVYPCCTVLIIEVINSNSHCSLMLLIILLSTDSPPPSLSLRSRWLVVQALRPVATSATSRLVGSMLFSQTRVLTYGL